jgi:retron-type reverse transcriptase
MAIRHTYSIIYLLYIQGLFIVYMSHIPKVYSLDIQGIQVRIQAICPSVKTSVVAFDLAQFFPSINHDVLLSILDKQGFAPEMVVFFKSYLVNWFTCYAWDDDLSLEFPSSVGVGQGSALSPILWALCLAPLLKEIWSHQIGVKLRLN